jgi:hypothetical protein
LNEGRLLDRKDWARPRAIRRVRQAADCLLERTMGDFDRHWAYSRAHPEHPFGGDRIEFCRGLTTELESVIESR